MTDAPLAELQQLRAELLSDVQLCSTRDQHIRLVQRINRLDSAIRMLVAATAPQL